MAASKDYDDQKVVNGLTERERETLPVWAQERLKDHRRTAEEAVKAYEAQFDSQEPTRIAYGDVYDNPRYLPDGQYNRISIRLDEEGTEPHSGVWFDVTRKTDVQSGAAYLEITAGRGISSVPQASNVLRLYPFADGRVENVSENPKKSE